jgi:quinoprotein glucose dehydrogenase
MNTGEHLWMIPVGETPQNVLEHPELKDVDIPNTGTGATPPMLVTPSMVVYASTASDGTALLFGVDKMSGEELARVEVPATSRYGMMTYMHEGRQYILLQTGGKLTAMALPESAVAAD